MTKGKLFIHPSVTSLSDNVKSTQRTATAAWRVAVLGLAGFSADGGAIRGQALAVARALGAGHFTLYRPAAMQI